MCNNSNTSFQSQLKAMLIRNFLLKIRHKSRTFMEIFLPLYFLGVLALMKELIPNPHFPVEDKPRGGVNIFEPYIKNTNHTVAVVPGTIKIKYFMAELNNLWTTKERSPIKFIFYENKEILEKTYWTDAHSFEMAVLFKTGDPLQGALQYELRSNPNYEASPPTTNLFSLPIFCRDLPNASMKTPGIAKITCPAYQYYHSGFVSLQTLIDYTKIKLDSGSEGKDILLPTIQLELFPKAAYTEGSVFRLVTTFCLVLALAQLISYLLVLIVGEKEKKLKEGMKMMGLRDSVYWLSWFIIYGVYVFILSVIATVLLYRLQIFQHSNYILIFLLILLFSLSIIMTAFMITPFFDKARTAGFLGNFAVNILSLLYFISIYVDDSSPAPIWFLSLISSSGFAIAFNKALVKDLSGDGVTLSNMWLRPGMSFGDSLIMMTVDIILYGSLAYYLDSVIPSEYGTKQPPWFPLTSAFWCSNKNKIQRSLEETASDEVNPNLESVPKEMKGTEVIEIINLSKSFQNCRKPEVKAVDGFNLNIYEGQITALLGHNGAGKTSIFNILTGLTSPTKGTIHIYGNDIRDPNGITKIRRMTGVCPQHDILFELLSPREHLEFFAAVRGVPSSQLHIEVTKTLKDIDLEDKADTFSKYLSGGQKRKLSVGIAIIGDPKIIILDEPTAGVDIFSRRHLWSVLQNKKHDKVILLTTHFMDEADILADRKAVISRGRLRCCGSSLFLKNKFGIGYRLTLVLGNTVQNTESRIINMVTRFVPKAEYSRRYGCELSFMLPHDSVDNFAPLFSTIEEDIKSKCLNITSYGVSMTTLEEVFFQLEKNEGEICEMLDLSRTNSQIKSLKTSLPTQSHACSYQSLQNECEIIEDNTTTDTRCVEEIITTKANIERFSLEPITTAPNLKQILTALLKVRLLRLLRDFKLLYSMILLPITFSVIGLVLITSTETTALKMTSLSLNESTYSTGAIIAVHNETSHTVNNLVSNFTGSVKVDWYDGSFASLLNTTSHVRMAAINITQCCSPSNLSFTIVYNDTQIHSLPIIINSINNAVYSLITEYEFRMVHSKNNETQHDTIMVSTYPFQKISHFGKIDVATFSVSFWLGTTLVIAPLALAVDLVYDREIKAKNQLRVNGITFMAYFGSYFIIFTSIMYLICSGILGLILLFNLPFLKDSAAVILLVVIISLYCPSSLIFSTCLSYVFDKAESALSILPNVSTFLGLIPFIIVTFLDVLQIGGFLSFVLHVLFSLIDPMYIPFAVFYYINQVHAMCDSNMPLCSASNVSDYLTKEIVTMMVGSFFQILLYTFVLLFIDLHKSGMKLGYFIHTICKTEPKFEDTSEGINNDVSIHEDNDVKAERQRVECCLSENTTADHQVILVQNLRKEYQSSNGCKMSELLCKKKKKVHPSTVVAVKNLSLAVESGEVFGLLGHNGAGKTTAIRIIIAEETPTKGRVQINGYNTIDGISDVFHFVGYCPQHDAQWKNITVREHLELYSSIRGVPFHQIQRTVDSFLLGLQIQEHADKQSHQCSGGTKRKLSFAMSMIGNPCIVLMDEPSSGMDPYSRRFLWDTIVASFQGERGAILTTHSMEEADALCTRVGIMVKGELRCIGSTQHLKNIYGAGYTLEMKLCCSNEGNQFSLPERHAALKLFVDELFSDASIENDCIGRIIYNIPQHAVTSLSECFARLEKAKTEFNIEEYSLSQTTLEQVFLKFANYDGDQ